MTSVFSKPIELRFIAAIVAGIVVGGTCANVMFYMAHNIHDHVSPDQLFMWALRAIATPLALPMLFTHPGTAAVIVVATALAWWARRRSALFSGAIMTVGTGVAMYWMAELWRVR